MRIERTFQLGAHDVRIETGEIARQATGAVLLDMRGTVVLATVVAARPRPGQSFFPLTVDFVEKTYAYAAGRIPMAAPGAKAGAAHPATRARSAACHAGDAPRSAHRAAPPQGPRASLRALRKATLPARRRPVLRLPRPRRVQAARAGRHTPGVRRRTDRGRVEHTLQASGRNLQTCLQDLDRFNALTPETENDAWYERPEAFTSMQLDAALPGFSRRRLAQLGDPILSIVRPVRQVLEVGCGSGPLSAQLVDTTQDWRLTPLDRSAAAVAFVEAYHRAHGTGHRVTCERADLATLPADDGSFDMVIAAEVLEHAPDADAATAELLRVLRRGGWLAVSLPIDLDIAMHPTVFTSERDILAFLDHFGLQATDVTTVRPDPRLDATAEVFPDFVGCVNAVFHKPTDPP